jgi:uncharacterized membrane protein YgcG
MTRGHPFFRPAGKGVRLPVAILALLFGCLAVVAANFPTLTGRIVDQANVISTETRSALEPSLQNSKPSQASS